MTQDSLHVLSLIIYKALWLLLGVEDTFGIQQEKIKGQKNRENNENNRLARRCSIIENLLHEGEAREWCFHWSGLVRVS